MSEDALEAVVYRNEFYRDGYRKSLLIIVMLIVSNIFALISVYNVLSKPSPVAFFATSPDGRIIPVLPLSEPGMKNSEVVDWATKAAIRSYTYDFVNYRASLQQVSQLFTGPGWTKFQEAMTKSRMLKTVVTQELVMTAKPTAAAVISQSSPRDGRYTWKVEVPMILFLKGKTNLEVPVKVTMLLQRVSLVNNPDGIAIVNFVVSE